MIRASIDIGSNSVLLLVAEINLETQQIVKEVLNLSWVTSLGKDLDKENKFHPDSMKSTYEALLDYKNQLQKFNIHPVDVIATATEASRVATNAGEFYKKIELELGFKVTLITSEGEAFYTALGVISGVTSDESELVVMDIGGASTELIRIGKQPFHIISTISLPVGSVRATDWYADKTYEAKMRTLLNKDLQIYETQTLICVAGSMTSLASMYLGLKEYDEKKIDGLSIDLHSFIGFSNELQKTNVDNLRLLFPHLGKRAPMLSAASLVAREVCEKLKIKTIKISTRGLRYGTLIKGEIDDQFTIG